VVHRFAFLAAPLLALPFIVYACGSDDSAAPPSTQPDTNDEEPDEDGLDDGGSTVTITADDGGTSIPTKIRYVLVIVKENHTFDNYFTGLPGAETSMTAKLSDGTTYTRPAAQAADLSQDICHANSCAVNVLDNGKMDRFDQNNAGKLPFIRYTEEQIPNYWQYARNFAIADHFFSHILGPSTPGHSVMWTGRSLSIDNAKCNNPDGGKCVGSGCTADTLTTITSLNPDTCATKKTAPCFDVPSLTDHLPANFSWMDYGGPQALMIKSVAADPNYKTHFRKGADLAADLGKGQIANLTIAHLSSGVESEHPTAYPCVGENFTVDIVNAAMKLPQWKEMAIVITWDDWGGFYDHVAPKVTKCANGGAIEQGFRLPAIIVSPYAKKGFVLKTPTEQASIPRLVEELWGMPFMTARDKVAHDGTAGSLMEAFDFAQMPRDPLLLQTHACP